ncbi:AcrR family transcriptional regulator [Nocardioides thalensis]|uniref:AcrR family transcriptional regulator n=1 Tax=Nocardioides thalensis TaxID=1914755 RepID=A0A853C3R0_9ACTN|nr:TetR/AcrR family transcriptional regulator [Nocardioides thalensis]NYJ01791.1 AcrR family transcriptional regulator [Nocardioides thalensis]
MPQGPRERLIVAAIELVRERGVAGTGLADLLERSDSARRSVYQHFPGGKLELIDAATRAAGAWMQRVMREVGATMDSATLLVETIRQTSANLVDSDFRLGCPVAAAAAAPADAVAVREAAAASFEAWAGELAAKLEGEGHPREEARSLAGFVVSSVEGALLAARAARSTEPLDQAARHLAPLLARR